ncbi:thiamine ABC transporter ATP-binding protein [Rhizobium oryzicola]|uniref:ATP-binding cassette domain-containing protein n=1 Tax=Rhizobium oryzicola TaxID=1232668 RepID=A0ABT8T4X4_9HYPH|nr:ATP-binding cassette domain-containing protein [Rhizobium oryzicola]MDO1585186.1 ATP-binding cassette domain-containing protein [Rhizobium oryzicola]
MKDGQKADILLREVRLALGEQRFHFDCSIGEGLITAITGRSGSGKSTLLNLVAGFEAPQQGRIVIGGQDVTELHPSERPVSLVFQDNNLFTHLDLFTNIALGISPSLRLAKEDRRNVSAALERVGLGGFETRKPGTLSGGERQRAAFARALVRRRPVLLLDEPFAALDPALRSTMADLLLELHRDDGTTILMVTHDLEEVRRLADEVLFVEEGRISFAGKRDDFLAQETSGAISEFLRRS